MSEYIRTRDYREQQLLNMPNGQIFQKSALTAADVLAVGADHVTIAMGARWRKDVAQDNVYVTVADAGTEVLTTDDIMEGRLPTGPRVLFDGDGYYMGGVIAERVLASGQPVTLVTPLDSVSYWAQMTSERWRIRAHLMKLGVGIVTAHGIAHFDGAQATLTCQYSGREMVLPTKSLVVVGHRAPSDALYQSLLTSPQGLSGTLPFTLKRISDCEACAIIAAAVAAGHGYGREMDDLVNIDIPIRHARVDVRLIAPAQWKIGA